MYRWRADGLNYLLVHPGGPFWRNRDNGAWSIPKGEYSPGQDPLTVAVREFTEETGMPPSGAFQPLGDVVQRSGKVVSAFAVEGEFDPQTLRSNMFELAWPPRSGQTQLFPEVDRAEWFSQAAAEDKILPAQRPFIARLAQLLPK